MSKFYSKKKIIMKYSIIGGFILTLLLLVILINLTVKNFSDKNTYSNDYSVVYQCNYNEITEISISNTENIILVKTDNGWVCNDNTEIKVGNDEILRFLMEFKSIIGNKVSGDNSNFGFENPLSTVIIKNINGSTAILTVGNKIDDGYFVKFSGNSDVYLVSELNSRVFFTTVDNIRDKNVFTPMPDEVISITVENENGEFSIGKFDSSNPSKNALLVSDWQVTYPIKNQCKDEYVIKNLFSNMKLKTEGFYEKKSSLYSEYKLLKPICRVSYEYADGIVKKLSFGEVNDGSIYVDIEGDEFIYKVPSRYLSVLTVKYHELLSSLAEIEKIENVNSIDITYNDTMHSITVERNEGKTEYKCDGVPITKEGFSSVYEKIMSIYIEGSIELSGEGTFVCSVSIVYNEGLTSKVIDFYTYENQYAAIIVNGELNYFTSLNKVQSIIDEFEKLL